LRCSTESALTLSYAQPISVKLSFLKQSGVLENCTNQKLFSSYVVSPLLHPIASLIHDFLTFFCFLTILASRRVPADNRHGRASRKSPTDPMVISTLMECPTLRRERWFWYLPLATSQPPSELVIDQDDLPHKSPFLSIVIQVDPTPTTQPPNEMLLTKKAKGKRSCRVKLLLPTNI
jgi:hypothetical protein